MIQCEPSNIFIPRNNWNIKSLKCKIAVTDSAYINRAARIIKEETGVDPFDSIKFQKREFVIARQILMVILTRSGIKTLHQVGAILGKDHSTVIHARKTIENLYHTDKLFKITFDNIINKMQVLYPRKEGIIHTLFY